MGVRKEPTVPKARGEDTAPPQGHPPSGKARVRMVWVDLVGYDVRL